MPAYILVSIAFQFVYQLRLSYRHLYIRSTLNAEWFIPSILTINAFYIFVNDNVIKSRSFSLEIALKELFSVLKS